MNKIKAGDPITRSEDIVKQNLETIKALFPTIVKEGKIDVDELKALIGDEVETGDEYYRFTWAGKSIARREANKPTTATLRPNKADSKDWDTTQNIFIEGDNLEVLKLLQKSYADKVKMIYIDPPYNTGKDFVYKDNYADNLGNYLALTGQVDDEGKKIGTNTESDGRYHSNWLNMMYPRLKLARTLLKDDGTIFISIDDNEVQNLRKLCDEIFGEDNFVANVIWEKKFAPSNDAKWFSDNHDHILVYAKSKEIFKPNLLERSEEGLARYKNPDNDHRGVWVSGDMTVKTYNAQYDFGITTPSGREVFPPAGICWRFSKDKVRELIADGRVWFGENGENVPRLKRFLTDVKDGVTPLTIWYHKDVGHNQEAAQELRKLFNGKQYFDTPKPIRLLKRIIHLSSSPMSSDIILDFFAGSGTTAQAVMQLNSEDGGQRNFICVQLPEPTPFDSESFKDGLTRISQITRERILKGGDFIKSETKKDLFNGSINKLDIGFKAFKLDTSNIRAWDGNPENFENNLFNSASNIKEGRTEEDVLFEILLKNGLDLTLPIEEKVIAGKKVFNIGAGALFICLADNITTAVAEGIGKAYEKYNLEHKETMQEKYEPLRSKVIFKDNGFTDVEKTNSIQILKRYGVTDVNSI